MTEPVILKRRKTNKKFMVLSAIGIIMVVDDHCGSILGLFTPLIPYDSFFMPMFVFISGYFNHVDADTSLKDYILNKVRSLLVPYVIFSLLIYFVEQLKYLFAFGSMPQITFEELRFELISLLIGIRYSAASPMWFIHSLFFVLVVYAVLKKLMNKIWNSVLMLIIFCLLNILAVWYTKTFVFPPSILILSKCFFFMPFIELGIMYREKYESKLSSMTIGGNIILMSVLLLINLLRMMLLPVPSDIYFINLAVMGGFMSPYAVTPLISSVIGILFWLVIADAIGIAFYENRIINYISENTMWILCLHVLFFSLLNSMLLFINEHIIVLQSFSVDNCLIDPWYQWAYYPQLRYLYFVFGIAGPLILKLAYDRVRIITIRTCKP